MSNKRIFPKDVTYMSFYPVLSSANVLGFFDWARKYNYLHDKPEDVVSWLKEQTQDLISEYLPVETKTPFLCKLANFAFLNYLHASNLVFSVLLPPNDADYIFSIQKDFMEFRLETFNRDIYDTLQRDPVIVAKSCIRPFRRVTNKSKRFFTCVKIGGMDRLLFKFQRRFGELFSFPYFLNNCVAAIGSITEITNDYIERKIIYPDYKLEILKVEQ